MQDITTCHATRNASAAPRNILWDEIFFSPEQSSFAPISHHVTVKYLKQQNEIKNQDTHYQ
jgi:hypothetical protein